MYPNFSNLLKIVLNSPAATNLSIILDLASLGLKSIPYSSASFIISYFGVSLLFLSSFRKISFKLSFISSPFIFNMLNILYHKLINEKRCFH